MSRGLTPFALCSRSVETTQELLVVVDVLRVRLVPDDVLLLVVEDDDLLVVERDRVDVVLRAGARFFGTRT